MSFGHDSTVHSLLTKTRLTHVYIHVRLICRVYECYKWTTQKQRPNDIDLNATVQARGINTISKKWLHLELTLWLGYFSEIHLPLYHSFDTSLILKHTHTHTRTPRNDCRTALEYSIKPVAEE